MIATVVRAGCEKKAVHAAPAEDRQPEIGQGANESAAYHASAGPHDPIAWRRRGAKTPRSRPRRGLRRRATERSRSIAVTSSMRKGLPVTRSFGREKSRSPVTSATSSGASPRLLAPPWPRKAVMWIMRVRKRRGTTLRAPATVQRGRHRSRSSRPERVCCVRARWCRPRARGCRAKTSYRAVGRRHLHLARQCHDEPALGAGVPIAAPPRADAAERRAGSRYGGACCECWPPGHYFGVFHRHIDVLEKREPPSASATVRVYLILLLLLRTVVDFGQPPGRNDEAQVYRGVSMMVGGPPCAISSEPEFLGRQPE